MPPKLGQDGARPRARLGAHAASGPWCNIRSDLFLPHKSSLNNPEEALKEESSSSQHDLLLA